MIRSRLSRRLESKSIKTILISTTGIIILFFFFLKYGLPMLTNLSLFLSNTKNIQEEQSKNNLSSYVAPPVLNPIPDATKEKLLTVSGSSLPNQTINLYLNDELIDKIATNKDGKFNFKDIGLSKDKNIFKVKAISDDKESDFSNQIEITYKDGPPSLDISNPTDGQTFSKDENNITVSGKTDPGAKVTVNDYWAIVNDNGNFSYRLTLQSGENKIKVIATDQAENKTEKELKVIYNQ